MPLADFIESKVHGRHKSTGPEEEYFFRQNQELIRQKRSELDGLRAKREWEERKQMHWMKCPKCGADMKETEMSSVRVDECTKCHGVYFDPGEIEMLLRMRKPWLLLRRLKLR